MVFTQVGGKENVVRITRRTERTDCGDESMVSIVLLLNWSLYGQYENQLIADPIFACWPYEKRSVDGGFVVNSIPDRVKNRSFFT